MKIATALLPLLALGLAPASQVAASPVAVRTLAGDAQGLIEANEAMQRRMAALQPGDEPPLLSNDGAELVRTAFDADTIRAAPLDAMLIGGMCQAIGKSIIAYSEVYAEDMRGPGGEPAVLGRIQEEFALGTAAGNICGQRAFRAIEALAAGLGTTVPDQFPPALQMMRAGASMTIQATLAILQMKEINLDNQQMMLAALNEDSAAIAGSLPKGERATIARQIRAAIAGAEPALRPGMEQFARSFDATACNKLCEIAGG